MSDSYKCDACGKFFLYKTEGGDLQGTNILHVLKDGWYPKKIDLCGECAKSLRKYLIVWWGEVRIKKYA